MDFRELRIRFKKMTPREQFIEFMTDSMKLNGLNELSSRILATLFLETENISLEEVADKTGYSLSSISTSIAFMEQAGLIQKYKKPHSKKIYLKIENDMIELLLSMLKRKQERTVKRSKEVLPSIIDAYKKTKSSKKEQQIIEKYYQDILLTEGIIDDLIVKIEKIRRTNS
ncbi:MAG: GbsR/MarR family transcriptional regulator [Candidatus Woesearchaeota archaeon]